MAAVMVAKTTRTFKLVDHTSPDVHNATPSRRHNCRQLAPKEETVLSRPKLLDTRAPASKNIHNKYDNHSSFKL